MDRERTRADVAWLLNRGFKRAEIARILGLSKPTISYHAAAIGAHVDARFSRRYDWPAIQRYYESGQSRRECQLRFGFSDQAWADAIGRGVITPRPHGMPIEQLLAGRRSRTHLKQRLISAGLLETSCALCGLADWRGEPLSLELHHANGDRHDNRLENLQLLCPNCHSQTDNWGGRNRRRPAFTVIGGNNSAA